MAKIAVQTLGGAASNAVLSKIFDGKVDYYDSALEGFTGSLEAPLIERIGAAYSPEMSAILG